jgi:DNA-directed RNA polymerase specialized sigma24 family protein
MSPPISRFDTFNALAAAYSTEATNALKKTLDKLPPDQRDVVASQIEMQRMQELADLVGKALKDEEEKSILRNFAI